MKHMIAMILALCLCLSLCGCGSSEKQETTEEVVAGKIPEATEQRHDNVIRFGTPVVVAEDENLRVELVRFYQDYFRWNEYHWPVQADASVEGTTVENVVVFKFHNKSDQDLYIEVEEFYLGSDGAHNYALTGTLKPAAGKNLMGNYVIQTGEDETLKSMEELYSLDGEFEVFFQGEDGVLRNRYELKFSIPDAFYNGSGDEAQIPDNSDAWKQFRDYLQERGPVTVVTDKTDAGQNQVTLEVTAGIIQITHEGESTTVSGKVSAHARNSARFDLPANVKSVDVHMEYWVGGYDEDGSLRIQSATPNYTWDIQSYHSGDEISFATDFTDMDENGDSIQKKGTLSPTRAFIMITDALSQTLAESGLGVSMEDLGFISY